MNEKELKDRAVNAILENLKLEKKIKKLEEILNCIKGVIAKINPESWECYKCDVLKEIMRSTG